MTDMKLQVLVAAMHAEPRKLCEQMNLSTDAIVVNQCEEYRYEEFTHREKTIRVFHMKERGVGLSRSTALLRSDGDICLFSDEDIVLEDNYEEVILKAFEENPDADVIAFQVDVDPRRATYRNTRKHRIRWYNFGRYPTYAVAARRETLHRAGVTFSLLFGGGALYSNGEDSLFLHDCLKKGLHLYAETGKIGRETYRESTWFHGYDQKFFYDRGYLFAYLYGWTAYLWLLRYVLVKRKMYAGVSMKQAYRFMCNGLRDGRRLRAHD